MSQSKPSRSGAAKTLASNDSSSAERSAAAKNLASGHQRQQPKPSPKPKQQSKQQPKEPPAAQNKSGDGRGRVTALAAQQASQASMQRYKMEAAKELGIDLQSGKLTRQQAGQLGGRVVQKMVAAYEKKKK